MPTTEHKFSIGQWVVEMSPTNGTEFFLWRISRIEIYCGGERISYSVENGGEEDTLFESELISLREFEDNICS